MKSSWTFVGLILFGQFVIILASDEIFYNFHFTIKISNEVSRESFFENLVTSSRRIK